LNEENHQLLRQRGQSLFLLGVLQNVEILNEIGSKLGKFTCKEFDSLESVIRVGPILFLKDIEVAF